MTNRLILLRHGQTHYNATMRMQGQMDTDLSEFGIEQARVAAEVLAVRRPVRLVSSDLKRAHDTAAVLGGVCGLDVIPERRLRETDLGAWQDLTHQDVDSRWPGARGRWRSSPWWAPPGGETRVEVARRTREVVDELVETLGEWGSHPVVLVAHGGAIAALTGALLELPVDNYAVFNGLGNTNWVQLSAHPRPDPEWAAAPEGEVGPTTPAAREILWRLDAWNASAQHHREDGR